MRKIVIILLLITLGVNGKVARRPYAYRDIIGGDFSVGVPAGYIHIYGWQAYKMSNFHILKGMYIFSLGKGYLGIGTLGLKMNILHSDYMDMDLEGYNEPEGLIAIVPLVSNFYLPLGKGEESFKYFSLYLEFSQLCIRGAGNNPWAYQDFGVEWGHHRIGLPLALTFRIGFSVFHYRSCRYVGSQGYYKGYRLLCPYVSFGFSFGGFRTEPSRLVPETPIVKRQKTIPKFPPDLIVSSIKFAEPSGNNLLDAQERGEIIFTLKNQGKGRAVGVAVKTFNLQGGEGLVIAKSKKIGEIYSKSSKRVTIPIVGTKKTQDGMAKLRIEIKESYGFDADPFTLSFGTKRLFMPEFAIVDIKIDDDRKEESYGDNNGVIERGEAIEVSVGIQNLGEGEANNTEVSLSLPQEGQNLFYNSKSKRFNLGTIEPGGYKVVKFCFMTNKRFEDDKIPVYLDISSRTGDYRKRDKIILDVGTVTRYKREISIAEKEQERKQLPKRVELSIDVDNVPFSAKRGNPDAFAVIVGIEEYKYAPVAEFANRDAMIFYEYAKKVLCIPERNIYIRTNEDATKGEFDKIFGSDGWLERRIKKESKIYIYYSGHGSPDVKTHKPYIIPYDIDPNYAKTAVSLESIYSSLSRLESKSITIFLDACFSGEARNQKMILSSVRPLRVVPILENAPFGLTIFTASSGSQMASAYEEKKHGLFTYFLLKGLKGEGDKDGDRKIRAFELFEFIKGNVESKAIYMDREQTPEFQGERERIILELE
ncbi:caspase family protein [candidate division WOR-3 bacterium]|nr:caspase family protein [candidate division WOR-3 bacterium]